MSDNKTVNYTMDPNNLSGKDVLIAVSPLIVLCIGIACYVNDQPVLAALLLVPLVAYFVNGFVTAPWAEIGKKAYEAEQIQKQTLRGRLWLRVKRAADYVSLFFFAITLIGISVIIYQKVFADGS
jgi:hypothetical protein